MSSQYSSVDDVVPPMPKQPSSREATDLYYSALSEVNKGNFGEIKDAEGRCLVVADPGQYLEAIRELTGTLPNAFSGSRINGRRMDEELSLFWRFRFARFLRQDEFRKALQEYKRTCEEFPDVIAKSRAVAEEQKSQDLPIYRRFWPAPTEEELKKQRFETMTAVPMVTKTYHTGNPVFSELILLSEIKSRCCFSEIINYQRPLLSDESILSDTTHRKWLPYRKRLLEDIYGLQIHVESSPEGATVSVSMRKFAPFINKGSESIDQLITLIDLLAHLGLTHSDIKPDNIMTDHFERAWLVDLDNLIQESVTGGFSCDQRFYRFRAVPSFQDRVLHDKALVRSFVASSAPVKGLPSANTSEVDQFEAEKAEFEAATKSVV